VVAVEPDLLHEVVAEDGSAEDPLLAGRVQKHGLDVLSGRLNIRALSSVDQHHEVVIAPARDLRATP